MNIKYIISLSLLTALTCAPSWGAVEQQTQKRSDVSTTEKVGVPATKRSRPTDSTETVAPQRAQVAPPAGDETPAQQGTMLPELHDELIGEIVGQMDFKRMSQENLRGIILTNPEYINEIKRAMDIESRKLLAQHNDNPDVALIDAAGNNYSWAIDYLIQRGANLDAKDSSGWSALTKAADKGHETIVAQLIYAGAKINATDRAGYTPLHWAAFQGHGAAMAHLIAAGADIDRADSTWGKTPLMMAAQNGQKTVAAQLLRAGADINAKARYGDTALKLAIKMGREAVAKLLIEAGADRTDLPADLKRKLEKWIGG